MKNLFFITGNQEKFKEIQFIIPKIQMLEIDLMEIQSLDPREVIKAKLIEASRKYEDDFIVEDVSFSLDCLNGLPGTLIKWFAKTIGNEGLLKICQSYNNYLAVSKVTIGYLKTGEEPEYFEGIQSGTIVEPRGNNGWGFDPIFLPEGFEKTYAEMTSDEKYSISMRKIAAEKLKAYLDLHDQEN